LQSLRALDEVELHLGARALAAAFREYASLNEEIAINRIDVAPDGQTATVNAVLAITQVVKIGRAAPVTRNVVVALRRQGDRWPIDSIKSQSGNDVQSWVTRAGGGAMTLSEI
jgi:hypothetical protein